jgi:hypothetical protein
MSDTKDLELRLDRIEKAISGLGRPRSEVALTEADIAAYHRVRQVMWDEGTCGINETSPCVISCRIIDKICRVVPIPIPIPRPCDFECTCGPCNVWSDIGALRGGGGRFGGFGR